VHAEDLPEAILRPESSPGPSLQAPSVASSQEPAAPSTHPAPPGELDRETLQEALNAHQWRREDTARALGISRTTLWRRMREVGLTG
jgi:transcriptional regulator of acetoin/glycerol metabolism